MPDVSHACCVEVKGVVLPDHIQRFPARCDSMGQKLLERSQGVLFCMRTNKCTLAKTRPECGTHAIQRFGSIWRQHQSPLISERL